MGHINENLSKKLEKNDQFINNKEWRYGTSKEQTGLFASH